MRPARSGGFSASGALRFPCALGRAGRRVGKREGDGQRPSVALRCARSSIAATGLCGRARSSRIAALDRHDGWCDDPADRNYNRRVRHPYPAGAEHLWRHDRLYDVIVVLGYNETPRVKGRGSAIFMHVAGPGMKPTEGCIALSREHLLRLIACARRGATITILPSGRLDVGRNKKTARRHEATGPSLEHA